MDKPILDILGFVPADLNALVSDFITANGEWNADLLFAQLPAELALRILGYPLPKVLPTRLVPELNRKPESPFLLSIVGSRDV